jgi:hypothetical protein
MSIENQVMKPEDERADPVVTPNSGKDLPLSSFGGSN